MTVRRLVTSVTEWSQTQFPFVQKLPLRPWEKMDFGDDGLSGDEEPLSEEWLREQEDGAGIRQIKNIIHETINNTVIFVPARSRDFVVGGYLSCRLSFPKLSNFVYWAMNEDTDSQLQAKGLRLYYNALLEVRNSATQIIEEAKYRIRL